MRVQYAPKPATIVDTNQIDLQYIRSGLELAAHMLNKNPELVTALFGTLGVAVIRQWISSLPNTGTDTHAVFTRLID